MPMLEWLADETHREEISEVQRHFRCEPVLAAILLALRHMTDSIEATEAACWMAAGVREVDEPETDDGQGEQAPPGGD